MSLIGDERVEELLAKEIELEAEIARLRDQLGEALVRENNLIAALDGIVVWSIDHNDAKLRAKRALANEQVSHLGE